MVAHGVVIPLGSLYLSQHVDLDDIKIESDFSLDTTDRLRLPGTRRRPPSVLRPAVQIAAAFCRHSS